MTSLIWFASDRNVSCEHPHIPPPPPPENEDALSAMEPALGLRDGPLLFTDTIAGRPGGPGAPAQIREAEGSWHNRIFIFGGIPSGLINLRRVINLACRIMKSLVIGEGSSPGGPLMDFPGGP